MGGTVYPVAIKYDAKFGDAFWNRSEPWSPSPDTSMTTSLSSKYSMVTYLLMMMTSWAIVCDVYYLPPTTKREVTH